MIIKDIKENDRPREKMLEKGIDALGDNELLAILIDTGTKNKSAIELANNILEKYSLRDLIDVSYEELTDFNGIKMAKATKIMAAFELAKRSLQVKTKALKLLNSQDIYSLMRPDIIYLKEEKVYLILLNCKCELIKKLKISDGDVAEVNISYLKIVELYLKYKAHGLILVHNHPSGDPNPSDADKIITTNLKRSLDSLGINLIDHIIVTKDSYFSFLENNLLNDYL